MLERLALAVALATMSTPQFAHGQDGQVSFFQGKTITLIVGTTAGSGYDAYARLIARHMGAYVPGNPSIVVSNMPGAGSNVAANFTYNAAPKDGTVVGALLAGALLEPLLGTTEVRHDPSKFQFLGSANKDVYVCAAKAGAPVATFEDVFTKELVIGAAPRTGIADYPTVLNAVLHTRFKVIVGYPGNREVSHAVDTGEVAGVCGVAWPSLSAVNPGWFGPQGTMKLLVQTDLNGYPELNAAGIPNALDFAKTDEQRQLLRLFFARGVFGRPYLMAPDVPRERAEMLKNAFMATLADRKLLSEAKEAGMEVDPVAGDEIQRLIADSYAAPKDLVAKLKTILMAGQ